MTAKKRKYKTNFIILSMCIILLWLNYLIAWCRLSQRKVYTGINHANYVELLLEYQEVKSMSVEKTGEKYRCNICGNEVVVTKAGGGTLVCCGEDMELIE
jgi:desulfoferrodoxin-like iron-binding protein